MRLGDVQIRQRGDVVIARLTGEVDLSNAQGIGQAITRGISHDATAVVLDLGELEYLDSAGIQLMYQLSERIRARAQQLLLAMPEDSPAGDAIRLAGISGFVDTYPSVEAALAHTPGQG